MCFIRDILFGPEVDKKGCALDWTCRLTRNYSSCLPLELLSVNGKKYGEPVTAWNVSNVLCVTSPALGRKRSV